jgi:hypothetical protein
VKVIQKMQIDLPTSLTLIEIPSFSLLVLYSVAITIAAPQQNHCESAEQLGIYRSAWQAPLASCNRSRLRTPARLIGRPPCIHPGPAKST